MSFTQHGWPIYGTPDEGMYKGHILDCGGPAFCDSCKVDVYMYKDPASNVWPIYPKNVMSPTLFPKSNQPDKESKMSMFTLTTFTKKPFSVSAVKVTTENMKSVCEWAGGEIHKSNDGNLFIKIRVLNPRTARQSKAFIGDWVLSSESGKRIYTDNAFFKNFEPVKEEDALF